MSVEGNAGARDESADRALAAVLTHPLLRELEPRVRADVRAAFRVRRFDDGSLVFAAGDPADSVFVVGAGAVDSVSEQRAQHEARAARRVRAGELLGEEALAPGARRAQAVAVGSCVLVEIPVPVLRRAAERSFGTRLYREERRARRAAFRALLSDSPLGRGVPEAAFEALFSDAAEERHPRGGDLAFAGERACLIVDGLFRVGQGAEEAGFRARGDMLGLVEALADEPFANRVQVISDAVVLQFPKTALRALARSAPHAVERALARERAARERQQRVLRAEPARETRVALSELGRLASASSLLAIELDRCARCGHCAKACADTHGDARLLRQGEKVVATLITEGTPRKSALLFPVACQHCHEPACLSACPTGAIVREASSVVSIRDDLCTGCGACATACPWDAVRMRERSVSGEVAGAGRALVASKCDRCLGQQASACVEACPTGAIIRLTPKRDVLELGALALEDKASTNERPSRVASAAVRSHSTWIARVALLPPLLALVLLGVERAGSPLRLAAGVVAAVLVALLAAQSWVKRSARARSRVARWVARDGRGALVRQLLGLHGLFGALSLVAALIHAGPFVPTGLAGVLWFSFLGCALSGALGAFAYRVLPGRITRLERSVVLPEDAPRELERLLDGLFIATTGQNAAVKQLLASVLMPYVRSRAGVLELLTAGRGLAEENARLEARIERALAGHMSARLTAQKPLIATAVALRAERAKRALEYVLGAFVPVHLVLTTVTLVTLALHVAGALL